jgi:quercetin dioxygenase-like cupin family protein
MQATLDVHGFAEGCFDFEFYRRRAARRLRVARRMLVRHSLGIIVRTMRTNVSDWTSPAALRAHFRPILQAGAAAALLVSVVAVQSLAEGNHHHHIIALPDTVKWMPGPPSLPPGAEVAMLEGNPSKAEPITMRLKFPAGYQLAPHTHPAIEHVTVLSGTFHIAPGESFDQSKDMRLPTGSFVVMPVGVPHFAWASEETVIPLHSVGPWGITYVNPADDPRKK